MLRKVVDGHLRPALEATGFQEWLPISRRAFSTVCFRKLGNAQCRYVEVQRNKWWTNQSGEFAINLGLIVPVIESARQLEAGTTKQSHPDDDLYWTLQERLGHLEHGEDRWWSISPDADLTSLGQAVVKSWSTVGAPWFDSVADLQGVRAWIVKSRGLATAIYASEALGDKEAVRLGMEEAFRERLHNARDVLRWGHRRGYFDSTTTQKLEWALMQSKQDLEMVLTDAFQKSLSTPKP